MHLVGLRQQLVVGPGLNSQALKLQPRANIDTLHAARDQPAPIQPQTAPAPIMHTLSNQWVMVKATARARSFAPS